MLMRGTKTQGEFIFLFIFPFVITHPALLPMFISFSCRTRLEPPLDLQRMIWPCLDGELERVFEMRGQGDCKSDAGVTAIAFLVFLRHLRIVILQDAAAILLQKPERREHVYLKARVFTSEEFGVFQQDMRQELEKGTDQVRATVEEAMPGVNRHFDELYKRIGAHERKTDAGLAVSLGVLEEINKVKKSFSVGIEKAALVLANSIATGNKGREQKKEEEEEEEEEKREEASTQGEGGLHVVVGYQMVEKFLCVQDMVDCWKGKGRFYNMPIERRIGGSRKEIQKPVEKGDELSRAAEVLPFQADCCVMR